MGFCVGRSLFGLRDFSIAGDFLEMGFCVARSLFGPRDFALRPFDSYNLI